MADPARKLDVEINVSTEIGSPDAWLGAELIRIAQMDELTHATELDRLKSEGTRRGLKLDLRLLRKRVVDLRAAANRAEMAEHGTEAHDALIDRLNRDHFVFMGGDKVTVGTWVQQEGRRVLVQRSQQDFGLLLANEPDVFSPHLGKRVPAVTAWLRHPNRREVKGFVFEADPCAAAQRASEGYENLFEGFSVAPAEGDITPFLRHLEEIIVAEEPAGRRADIVNYLLDCMAHLVQRPGVPLKVAILLRGPQGAGKSFLTDVIASLFQGNTFETSHADDIVGKFNMHLLSTAVVVGDEAVFAGSKKDADTMKRLITQDILRVEGKHKDVLNARNRMSFLLTSNHEHAAHIEPRDRRFFVLNVSDAKTPRSAHEEYWGPLWSWAKSETGKAALLQALLERDISQFDAQRDRPLTTAHFEQVLQSLSGVEAWVFEALVLRRDLRGQQVDEARISEELRNELGEGATVWGKKTVHDSYARWCEEKRCGERCKNAPAFWKAMQQLFGPGAVTKKRVDGKPTHVFILPGQVEIERRFIEALGHSAEQVREILELGGSDVRESGYERLEALRATADAHDAVH